MLKAGTGNTQLSESVTGFAQLFYKTIVRDKTAFPMNTVIGEIRHCTNSDNRKQYLTKTAFECEYRHCGRRESRRVRDVNDNFTVFS